MINFINKFLESLNDEELSYMKKQVWEQEDKRFALKIQTLPSGLELLEEEKQLVRDDKMIQAIKLVRGRNRGRLGLKEAKDIVEAWRNKNCNLQEIQQAEKETDAFLARQRRPLSGWVDIVAPQNKK